MVKKHIAVWLAYLTCMWIFAISRSSLGKADFLMFLLGSLLLVGVFYFSYFISFPVFFEDNKLIGTIWFLVGLCGYICLRYLVSEKLMPILNRPVFDSNDLGVYLSNHIYLYFTYLIYALLVWYGNRSFRNERKRRIEEGLRAAAENEKITLEKNLALLQSQKSQANTFYRDTHKVLPETARGLSLLSKIMRYSLESSGNYHLSYLASEIDQLRNYIELMQLRYSGSLIILQNLDTGITNKQYILPHILITLVENAFKHGDISRSIHIELDISENQLTFIVENEIDPANTHEGTGLGLKNVRERLLLWYGNAYRFDTGKEDGKYSAKLTIFDCTTPFENPESAYQMAQYNKAS
jgi:two-component system, LytTR family, sensor kinase